MIGCIIQARMSSTRLPGKVLLNIGDKPILWYVYNRVRMSKKIDKIVVATSTAEDDDSIEKFCFNNNIKIYRGDLDDVIDRYYKCAKKNEFDYIVRITADCPLIDAEVIDRVINLHFKSKKPEFTYTSNTIEYTYPDGLDVETFSFKLLEEAWKKAKLPSEREHVTPYIKKIALVKQNLYCSIGDFSNWRLTLDEKEDFEVISKIYALFGFKVEFSFSDLVKLLKSRPEILEINQHIERNEGYKKSLEFDMNTKNAI